jgi:flavin reductase (DIM6/NTAB) family NADH-FMN oxidoreductase RutF
MNQSKSGVISDETFKSVMAAAPGPVAVVTATDRSGNAHGLTVSAVCSVSLNPRLALACLDLSSNTLAAVRDSGGFTINYLADGGDDLALHFATKLERKFDNCAWEPPQGGVGGPVLKEDIAAYAACRVSEMIDAGDHVVVLGEVVEGGASADRHAMAYARRRFFTGMSLARG